jgi:hypothetical protein
MVKVAPWQVEQTCVVGKWFAGNTVGLAPAKVIVELWQLEQSDDVAICAGKFDLFTGVSPTAKVWPL